MNVILYGNLKKLETHTQSTQISTLEIPYVQNESLNDCLNRLGLKLDDVGEMFINHCLSYQHEIIPHASSRIAIFPKIMQLIDGGLYIRYCGYRTQDINKPLSSNP